MKKSIATFTCLCTLFCARAQTVTPTVMASAGDSFSSPQGSIAWTLGEPVSETYGSASNITTMGFHQPEVELVTMIREQENGKAVLVYPNPVKEELSIDFSGIESGKYSFELVDALGKLILQTASNVSGNNSHVNIRMYEIAAGPYFLNISGKNFNKTVKINKTN